MTSFNELPQAKMGFAGEKYIFSTLMESGFWVFKCTDAIDSDARDEWEKAPKIHGKDSTLIYPDLAVFHNRNQHLVEVKTKSESTYYRIRGKYQHGINTRHYSDYIKVADITGLDLWLMVYEKSSGDILAQQLDKLPIDHQGLMWQNNRQVHMTYFNRDEFLGFNEFLNHLRGIGGEVIINSDSGGVWRVIPETVQQQIIQGVTV